MSDRLVTEVEALTQGRELSAVDVIAVEAFAGLSLRARDARAELEASGVLESTESGGTIAHPAADVERRASAELRGWVKDRPDLFGRGTSAASSGRSRFEQMRSVS